MTVTRLRLIGASALLLSAAACTIPSPSPEIDREARSFMALLARGEVDSALSRWDLNQAPKDLPVALRGVADSLQPFLIDSASLVGWHLQIMDGTTADLTYELHGHGRWSLANVAVSERGGNTRILGLHWQPLPASLATMNRFSLLNTGAAQLAYFILAIAAASVCLGTAVFAAFKRMGWRWVLFSLVGLTKASINWTTGQQALQLFSVQLFAASYGRAGLVAPLFISISLPAGAILTLIRWRARSARPASQPSVAA